MDLLKDILSGAKKGSIKHGITENCVILEVSNKRRKRNDGTPITSNTFIKFGKVSDGTVVSEKEISWFDVKHDSDYAYDNLFEQIFQMTNIAESVTSPEEVDEAFNAVFEEEEIETVNDLQEVATSKKGIESLIKGLGDAFVELVEPEVGMKSTKLKLKLVYSSNGKHLQQPKYGPIVERMGTKDEDSILRITSKELEYQAKSKLSPVTSSAPVL